MKATRHFLVYDKNTGNVLRTGSVPIQVDPDIDMVRAQVNNAEEWYVETDARLNPDEWKFNVAHGALEPKPAQQVLLSPHPVERRLAEDSEGDL